MKTILIVDDMAIFREPIEVVLRANGYDVLTASNGVEACSMITRQMPDLVLLDLGMPVMDGVTVLKWIRDFDATKRLRVIILSAENERSHVQQAARLGISGYLLKSHFSLASMLEAVEKAIQDPRPAATPEPQSRKADQPKESTPKRGHDRTGLLAGTESSDDVGIDRQHPLVISVKSASDDDLKLCRPLMSRSELLTRLRLTEELGGFSPTVTQILQITSNEDCSMEQVAKVVSQDHAIALKVMRLANSVLYSRGDRVDTVQKAVTRIGMQNIRRAVLNIGIVERFGSVAFDKHLSTQQFWEHSIACGIISAELARAMKPADPDVAFTAGLLHDLGRILYADRLGPEYVQVLEKAQSMCLPLERVEARLLLLNHAQLMEHILHAWRFPKDLVGPIVNHHKDIAEIRLAAPQQMKEVLVLGLADRLAHALMLGSSGNETIYPTEDHCRHLGVEGEVIRQIEEVASQQTDDTKFALLASSGDASWPCSAEQHRSQLESPLSPLILSEAAEIDAYRIFFEKLSGPAKPPRPNLAVAHINSAKDRMALAQRLVDAERSQGVMGLPLLMLSPGGRLTLDESVTQNRVCAVVATPTPIASLISVINQLLAAGQAQAAA